MRLQIQHTCTFKLLALAYLILQSALVMSQDIHFSNWQMSPLNLNPANTGLFEGDGRIIFNYRNQWKSVPVPYNTYSFGADFNLKKSFFKQTQQAIGVLFNQDVSGDGRYQITDLKVPFNHKFSFKRDSGLTVALGVLAGITNISVNVNRLSFDKQWDGDAYNEVLGNGESFAKQSKIFADVSLGTVIQKQFNSKIKASFGYGISHLNTPNISFNNTLGANLRIRHNESFQLNYSFNNISAIMFEYYGNQQQKFKENLVGLSYYHKVDPKL